MSEPFMALAMAYAPLKECPLQSVSRSVYSVSHSDFPQPTRRGAEYYYSMGVVGRSKSTPVCTDVLPSK
jgi:hypothetical protein